MKSFRLSLVKFILGFILFGLALFANPIEGYCASHSAYPSIFNSSITTPYQGSSSAFSLNAFNINSDDAVIQYGVVPYSSFSIPITFGFTLNGSNAFLEKINASGFVYFDVDLLFLGFNGGAYSKPIFSSYCEFDFTNNSYSFETTYILNTYCDGIPTGIRIKPSSASMRVFSKVNNYIDGVNSIVEQTGTPNLRFVVQYDFIDFSFDETSSSSSSSTIINNTTSNLVPIGYSSLNFGLNGNTYFLGASRIFEPSYLSPLLFSYDFANNLSGVISSAPLTLAMGGFDPPPNTAHASPIAVIGDTRAGEYELTIALCLSNSPTQSELSALTNLSNWGFEFNRGYSGQQFSMPSNARVSYTNFTDSKTGYVYTSVYFYFTTPDYFDSFLIRKAPSLSNIRVGAFAFNKYTGTISDQLNQSDAQWTYDNPSHNSFSSANSSAASTVSAFSSIESDAFSNLDTAMSGAGVNDFNINVISTPLATVSGMINQTYNILPDLIKWLILAILVIGIFAVIISANNYVNKD